MLNIVSMCTKQGLKLENLANANLPSPLFHATIEGNTSI
jgi:hypothetical protein